MLQNCPFFAILVVELKESLCLDTTINVLFVLHKLNLKNQSVMINTQYAVTNLCKGFGAHLLPFLMVVDSIQPTTESRCIIIL